MMMPCCLAPASFLGWDLWPRPACVRRAGFGPIVSEPHEPNRDSSDPQPREHTPGPGSLLAIHPLGDLAATSFVRRVSLAN